LLDRQDRLNG